MKIRPVGAELFHVDGQTDVQRDTTKLTVAFVNSANAPKNWKKGDEKRRDQRQLEGKLLDKSLTKSIRYNGCV